MYQICKSVSEVIVLYGAEVYYLLNKLFSPFFWKEYSARLDCVGREN